MQTDDTSRMNCAVRSLEHQKGQYHPVMEAIVRLDKAGGYANGSALQRVRCRQMEDES
jgi:hypothetical protein